jgi:integrase
VPSIDISKATHRRKLRPRSEPYWRKLAAGKALGVRIGRHGESWVARLTVDGKKTYQALTEANDYDEAERVARTWFDQQVAGIVHGATVEDAARRYVDAVKTAKGEDTRATKDAAAIMRRHCYGTAFGAIKLADLRQADVESWRDSLLATVSKATANRQLAQIKAMLNKAHGSGLIESDRAWTRLGKFPGADKARQTYLSVEQRRAFLDAAEGAVAHLIHACMLTGARPVELARATVADLDTRAGTLTLCSFKGRNGEIRYRDVPLTPSALTFFKQMKRGKLPAAPLLNRDDGQAWKHSDHDHLVRAARDKAGLPPGATLYAIRHSVITDMLTAGIDPSTVAKITGTSIEMISRNYGKLVQEYAKQALAGVVLS